MVQEFRDFIAKGNMIDMLKRRGYRVSRVQ